MCLCRYLNGCACQEHTELKRNYQGDIQQLFRFGFDAVKFDACGEDENMTYYAELMQTVGGGKNYTVENCHWGRCVVLA